MFARIVGAAALLLVAPGCSDQGEGERCDPDNYNDDCESGLTCTPLADLRAGAAGAVCCPTNPTLNICRSNDFNINDDAGGGETSMSESDAGETGASATSAPDAGPVGDASALDGAVGDGGETLSSSTAPDAISSASNSGASSSSGSDITPSTDMMSTLPVPSSSSTPDAGATSGEVATNDAGG